MKLTRRSPLTKTDNTLELPCTEAQFNAASLAYKQGAMVQDAFSFLDAGLREFVMTGYTPEDWKKIFPEEEEKEEADGYEPDINDLLP